MATRMPARLAIGGRGRRSRR